MTDTSMIKLWHQRARPDPTDKHFQVQLGCHYEEIGEMNDCLEGDDAETRNILRILNLYTKKLADRLKRGEGSVHVPKHLRKDMLDSLCDQVVTGVGVAYCDRMDAVKGLDIVNTSNWSKYGEDGNPIFDDNGKVKKGPRYVPPHLDECV